MPDGAWIVDCCDDGDVERPLVVEDRLLIERFRYTIYIEEQRKCYVGADHGARHLADILDQNAFHFVLRRDSGITGYFRVHPDLPKTIALGLGIADLDECGERIGYLSRLMVRRSDRAKASATLLLKAAYSRFARTNVRAFVGHTSPSLLPLWCHFGNRSFGRPFEMVGIGQQQPIVMIMGDTNHLLAAGSPLAACPQPKVDSDRLAHLKSLFGLAATTDMEFGRAAIS